MTTDYLMNAKVRAMQDLPDILCALTRAQCATRDLRVAELRDARESCLALLGAIELAWTIERNRKVA